MLMRRLIRYCRGTVQFTVTGAYPERFLNLCTQGGVGLWETRRTEDGIAACCAQCHRGRLEYYAGKSGCTLTVGRCSGIKNTARRYRRRIGLWVGAGLLVAGLLVMSRFVWRVEVVGAERLSPEAVTAALAEYGVHSGVLARSIDARTVERQMQIRFEEIAWISVNVEGSRVTAVLEEAVPPPAVMEDGIPTNLVAAETGFITRIEVRNGNAVVKVGDSVRAGDLLVSGIMDNKVGESRTAHARGQVYAQVRARIDIFTPLKQQDYVLRGIARRRYLRIFGIEVPLQLKGVPDDPYRVEHTVKEPRGLLALLPVALREDCYLLMRETEKTVTPEEARRQSEKVLALRERDWTDAEILSREPVGVDSAEGYTLTVEYLLEKQIAVEAPVQAEERLDEGTDETDKSGTG